MKFGPKSLLQHLSGPRGVDASPSPVMRRLLAPLTLLLLLPLATAGTLLYREYQQQLSQDLAAQDAEAMRQLRTVLNQQIHTLSLGTHIVAADKRVQKLLHESDGDGLLADWRPIFETWQRVGHLSRFRFLDAHRNCLACVDQPEKLGGRIERFTAVQAEQTGQLACGLEISRQGELTMEVVQPVLVQDALLGYVELGKSLEEALPKLHDGAGEELAVAVGKQYLDREDWEAGARPRGASADWDQLSHSVVTYASQGHLPKAFVPWADQVTSDLLLRAADQEIAWEGKTWHVSAMPLQDASGSEVASLLLLRDITGRQANFQRQLLVGGVLGGLMAAGVLGAFFALLRLTDTRLRAHQTRLRESEERYRLLSESSTDVIWLYDLAANRFSYVSPSVQKLRGYTVAEVERQTMADVLTAESNEMVSAALPGRLAALAAGDEAVRTQTHEITQTRRDGSTVPTEVVTTLITDTAGRVTHIQGISRDITERKRAEEELRRLNRALQARSACNQALVRAAEEHAFTEQVCRVLVEQGGYRLAWIGYAEGNEAKTVRPVAQAGFDAGYLETCKIRWADGEWGRGPTGTCIRNNELVVARHVTTDAKIAPWRQAALDRGYASLAAFPLRQGDGVLGALVVYSSIPDAFDAREVALLTDLADDLAFGIAALRTRAAQARAEAELAKRLRYQRVLTTIAAILRTAGRVTEVLDDVVQALLDASEMDRAYVFENVQHPERGLCSRQTHERVRAGIVPQIDNPLLECLPYDEISPSGMLLEGFLQRKPVRGQVDQLPPEERAILSMQGILDLVILPIYAGNQFWGFLGFDDCTSTGRFDDDDVALLQNVADLIGWHIAAERDAQTLRESQRSLATLMSNLPGMAYRCRNDHPWTMEFVSDGCLALTGYTVEDLTHNARVSFAELIHPEDREAVRAQVEMSVARGQKFEMTYRLQTTGGATKWVWEQGRAVYAPSGEPLALEGLILDVTAQKTAEEGLAKFRLLSEHASDLILFVRPEDGQIVEVNQAACEAYGYGRAELLAKTIFDLRVEDDAAVTGPLQQAEQGGMRFEAWHRRRDGSTFPVEVNSRAAQIGTETLLLSIIRDQTARQRMEAELRQTNQQLELLLHSLPVVTYAIRFDSVLYATYISSNCERITGFPPKAFQGPGNVWPQRLHPEDAVRILAETHELEDRGSYEREYRWQVADGSYRWFYDIAYRVPDASGGPLQAVGMWMDITQRKQAELELARWNQDLEQRVQDRTAEALELYHHAPCGYSSLGPDGLILQINDTYLHWLGYRRDEVEGRMRISDLLTPQSLALLSRNVPQFIEHETAVTAEADLRCKDGSILSVLVNTKTVRDENGRYLRSQDTILNITERKQAEERLRASEARFRRFIELAPMPIRLTNRRGEITYVNAKFTQTFGYRPEDIPTLEDWWQRAYPDQDDRRRVRELWRATETQAENAAHASGPEEYRILCHDGTERDVIVSGIMVGQEYLATFLDVTRLRQATENLHKLSQAVAFSPSMILITDRQGRIEYANPAWEQSTGYRLQDVLGQRPNILKSGEHSQEFYGQLWADITAGRIWRGEFHNRRQDGSLYWESASIAPLRNAAGDITHFVAVKENIDQQKRAAEELRQAKETAESASLAKSTFLANMSHEIRTPMNAILGFSQLLLRDPALSPAQHQQLLTIVRGGEHLMDIISDILEMARVEAGRVSLNPAPMDLPLMLDDLERMFRLRADAKRLQFRVERQGEIPVCIVADEAKLRQIIINLLSNAVKFTPPQGEVLLRVRSAAEPDGTLRLEVEVADSGIGIAEADLPHLFEPFFQTESGRQAMGGTGLGLPISRELVHLMGGELTVASQVGQGSTFRFYARVACGDEAAIPARAAVAPRVLHLLPGSPACRVLVADDKQENCDLLSQLLLPIGFEVWIVRDGAAAVAECQARAPHLVLLDLRMPVMDGYEAARRIRAAHGPAVKLVALSASAFEENQQQATAAGMDAFLAKPFRAAELLELIKELLGLEYVYDEFDAAQMDAVAGAPSGEDVRRLPRELVAQLRDATRRGDYNQILDLLERVAAVAPEVAARFQQLADQFDYDALHASLAAGEE